MGLLNPLFLLAAAAVAVPLLLHLFQRQDRRRIPFPALRYLQRTAKEHARSIRFRQLLLLLLRVGALLLVVLAAARLHLRGQGGAHPPTALAIILDNSPSSGLVQDDVRRLDELRELALRSLDAAGEDDRIWVIRAGEPGDVAPPGGAAEARTRVLETVPGGGAADLVASLERAAALVRDAGLPRGEIHLLSDLQASSFPGEGPLLLPSDVPVVVYRRSGDPPENRGVTEVVVGGGLSPLAGQRTQVAVRVEGEGEAPVPVRLVVEGRVVAASQVTPGGVAILEGGPFPGGWISGVVEIDPDAFRGDDGRFFAFQVRPPPTVALTGGPSPFLAEAFGVLLSGGRVISAPDPASAGVWIATEGVGVESRPSGVPVLVLPPSDPTLLPALNRRLTEGGVPWQVEAGGQGEGRPRGDLPVALGNLVVREAYRLVPTGESTAGAGSVLVSFPAGDPWLVEAQGARGPVLLMGSPLDPRYSTLPVSAAMVPFLEWVLLRWAAREGSTSTLAPGGEFPLPLDADRVVEPDGTVQMRTGTARVLVTRQPGLHRIQRGDPLLEVVAVNLDPSESRLAPLPVDLLEERVGEELRIARSAAGWGREIFPTGEGPEVWQPLLLAALLLLVAESWLAATGRRASRSEASVLADLQFQARSR
jgi:hypothetical protein